MPTLRATSLSDSPATPSRRASSQAASRIVAMAASRLFSRQVGVASPNTVRTVDGRSGPCQETA
jgi:hypothetical protein